MPKKHHDIISLEADSAVPDAYGLERFMEEINILELEGYYFCPARTEAGRRTQQPQRALTLGETTDQPVVIVLSAYGQPSAHTYKVLQATFFKLSEQGPDTTGLVTFSRREISRLTDTSTGGPMLQRHYTSIKQLRNTEVNCSLHFKERKGDGWEKKWRTKSFSFFSEVAFEGSERGRFSRVAVQVNSMIVQNFKNRHISYFNWERMRGLDMVGMMLYKRLFRHMANVYRNGNKEMLYIEKDYEVVCTTWLGLKPQKERTRIIKQLGKHLQALKDVRLLRECRIEPRVSGKGFKIVAFPGTGFFADYENIYVRKQAEAKPQKVEPEPLAYLIDFHKRLGHTQDEYAPKEVAYVRHLLSRFGEDGVRDFMDYGLSEAKKTSYDMQWFGALSTYEPRWEAQLKKVAKAKERQAAVAACTVCNEAGMLEFDDGTVGQCPHDLKKIAHIHGVKLIRGFPQA